LKKGINIPIHAGEKANLFLLIEICENGISLVWISSHPKEIVGAEVFNVDTNEKIDIIAQNIFNHIKESKHTPEKINVSFNYKESLLIPEKYHDNSSIQEMLNLTFGENEFMTVKTDHLKELSIYNIYRIPKTIEELCQYHFPNASLFHSTTKQIQIESDTTHLTCIVFYQRIKIILFKEGKLQFAQQFDYKTQEDVAYHLLNICERYNVSPTEIKLRLKGLVVKESKLYEYLYNYFLDINLASSNSKVALTPHIVQQTKYFLSHLIDLAACE
jgi:hypothetical protein